MRRLPVALSRTERALLHMQFRAGQIKASQRDTECSGAQFLSLASITRNPSQSGAPAACATCSSSTGTRSVSDRQLRRTVELLRCLHTIDHERRQLLREKQVELRRKEGLARSANQRLAETFRHDERQLSDAAAVSATQSELSQRTAMTKKDVRLLQSSLLARPSLSAVMWRLFLQEELWVSAVKLQRRLDGLGKDCPTPRPLLLLEMSLAMARVSLGTLKAYVDGAEVNARSPRFAVSIPSAAWRHERREKAVDRSGRKSTTLDSVDGAPNCESDVLFDMLCEDELETARAVPDPSPQKKQMMIPATAPVDVRLRWLPSHSAAVLPLVDDTLALFSFVIPELPIAQAVHVGCAAHVTSLLASVQKMASASLALHDGGRNPSQHETLHRLEKAMLAASHRFIRMLKESLRNGELPSIAPPAAARMVIELHHLRCLNPGDAGSLQMLESLVSSIFPELRTNTRSTLVDKARQSSLLAFATRKHRGKLLAAHGSRNGAETHLQESVIQQARLRQRMMAAALRERHLSQVHTEAISDLSSSLLSYDLVTLLKILTESLSRRAPRHNDLKSVRNNGMMVTAALFTVEAILHRHAMENLEPPAAVTDHARLWAILATLWPIIDTRRELLIQGNRHRASLPSGLRADDAKTETTILTFATESVMYNMNACVSERLHTLREAKPAHMEAGGAVTAQQTSVIAAGLIDWHSNATAPHRRPATVTQQVQLSAKLLRELLLRDAKLRAEVRSWQPEKREEYEQLLLTCLQTSQVLDTVSKAALRRMCWSA